jgi:hypothetical protein
MSSQGGAGRRQGLTGQAARCEAEPGEPAPRAAARREASRQRQRGTGGAAQARRRRRCAGGAARGGAERGGAERGDRVEEGGVAEEAGWAQA